MFISGQFQTKKQLQMEHRANNLRWADDELALIRYLNRTDASSFQSDRNGTPWLHCWWWVKFRPLLCSHAQVWIRAGRWDCGQNAIPSQCRIWLTPWTLKKVWSGQNWLRKPLMLSSKTELSTVKVAPEWRNWARLWTEMSMSPKL